MEMTFLSKCCIVGIPDQQGVMNVGGRIGAAQGPDAFRRVFSRFKGKHLFHEKVVDLGNVSALSEDVSSNHRQAARLISQWHSKGSHSVVIGGGHDHGYSQIQGVLEALKKANAKVKLGCLNIDAHLDVRNAFPKISSGSPFFLALESGCLAAENFIEFGIQSHCNGPELWEYIERKKVEVVPFTQLRHGNAVPLFSEKLKKLTATCDAVIVSFDLDAIASAFAPGVSAPQAEGLTAGEAIEIAEIAGENRSVVSLGVFELNPLHDVSDRTSLLAATLVYHFLEKKLF